MIIDFKAFTVQILPSKTTSFWWRNRYHVRRLWKRWIPWLAMTCDRCGSVVRLIPDQDEHDGLWWLVGCVDCTIITHGRTQEEAMDRWRRYGGKLFEPEYRRDRSDV